MTQLLNGDGDPIPNPPVKVADEIAREMKTRILGAFQSGVESACDNLIMVMKSAPGGRGAFTTDEVVQLIEEFRKISHAARETAQEQVDA